MKEVKLTKRQMRKIFRDIILSANKMCNLPYEDKMFPEDDNRRYKVLIDSDALEHIMKVRTDKIFEKNKND